MINSNELRIGNYVDIEQFNINGEVLPILNKHIIIPNDIAQLNDFKNKYGLKRIHGIKLTHELLERLGFKLSHGMYSFEDEMFYIEECDDNLFCLVNSHSERIMFNPILFFHQLQNIFFFLIGYELLEKVTYKEYIKSNALLWGYLLTFNEYLYSYKSILNQEYSNFYGIEYVWDNLPKLLFP